MQSFKNADAARVEARRDEAADHNEVPAQLVLPLTEDVWEDSLDWWDNIGIQQILLLNAPTIREIPEQLHHALQETLQNLLALLLASTSVEARTRAWKLFIAFPKLLLATE
eukprot:9772401-Prorocentrum_lima.AAC.1